MFAMRVPILRSNEKTMVVLAARDATGRERTLVGEAIDYPKTGGKSCST